jgi:CDP-diglyceride synthetase
MSTRQRAPTVIIGLIVAFAAVQYFSRLWFFLFIQAVILIALIELYNLGRRRNVFSPRWLGGLISILFGLSFYFVRIPLSLVLFAALFIAGTYFLLSIRAVEELMRFPTGMALTLFGAIYVSFTLNHFIWLRDEWGPFYIYFLLAVIFVGDSGAMYVGKALGKHRSGRAYHPAVPVEGCKALEGDALLASDPFCRPDERSCRVFVQKSGRCQGFILSTARPRRFSGQNRQPDIRSAVFLLPAEVCRIRLRT